MKKPNKPRSCLARALLAAGILAAALILILAGLGANQRIALERSRAQHPPPGRLVDAGGLLLHLHCLGSGSPTVLIDAGNGSFSLEWTPILEEVSGFTRACAFDRAGYGWSEPGPAPRDGRQASAELQALLQAAGEPGPYVLVGHSLGGIHARIFAGEYPEAVAGLVLVDTAPSEVDAAALEAQNRATIGFYQVMDFLTRTGLLRILGPFGGQGSLPETARKLPAGLLEPYLQMLLDPQLYQTAIAEIEQVPETLRQARAALPGDTTLGDLPLIGLTAGKMAAPGSTPFDDRRVPVPETQIEGQAGLARLSSAGEQRLLPESGHGVHLDAREAVVQAIADVVNQVRER